MKKIKKITLLAIALLLFPAIAACGSLSDNNSIWNQVRGIYMPGVFYGTGEGGFYGPISVRVTIGEDGRITKIEVTDHNETPEFAERAFGYLIPDVITVQSADVDTVSGATATSNGFIAAILEALSQALDAPGTLPSTVTYTPGVFEGIGEGGFYGAIAVRVTIDENGRIAEIEVTDHNETPEFAERAFGYLIPDVIRMQSADVDTVSGATATSNGFIAAILEALSQAAAIPSAQTYTPGVFDGIGEGGFYGPISVRVTIDENGKIAEIEVTDHNETPEFAERAFGHLIPDVIRMQSADVDTVSGATATSNAFLEAVTHALNDAR